MSTRLPLSAGGRYRPCVFHLADGQEFKAEDHGWLGGGDGVVIPGAKAVGNFSGEDFGSDAPMRTIYIPATSLLYYEPGELHV